MAHKFLFPSFPPALMPMVAALMLVAPSLSQARNAGVTWPEGQVFPRFAAIASLEVLDISNLAFDRKVLFTTLQGQLNKTSPRLYLADSKQSGEGKNFWLDRMTVGKTQVADGMTLFSKYKDEIKGLCIYDPAVMGTVDAAATAAGMNGGVVVSPALAAILGAAPYGFPTLIDLRNNHFAEDRAAYRWMLANMGPQCTHRILVGLKPDTHYPMMDYVVANKAMCLWLDPGNAQDKVLLDSAFSAMPVNGAYLGWWPGESDGVAYASGFGIITFASDWFCNATVHGSVSNVLGALPPLAAPPPLKNKCYIALVLSDGDNLQEQEHLFPIRWNDPLRGTFPVSWTQAPSLVDFAPDVLEYYYRTATPDDCFITGPSGVGYTYPENWKRADFPQFARLTDAYLAKSGIKCATLWRTTDWASDLYGQYCPNLLGMAVFGGPLGAHVWKNGIASQDMLPTYASFASQILEGGDGINTKLAAWNKGKPMFIAPELNANVAGLAEFQKVYDALKANPDVVFVRADQLFQLIREANGVSIGLSRSGKGPTAESKAGSGAEPLDFLTVDADGRLLKSSLPANPPVAGRYRIQVQSGAKVESDPAEKSR